MIKKRFEVGSRLDPEVLPEKTGDLFLLVRDARLQPRVVDVIAGPRIAIDSILPLVQAAFESYAGNALFCSAADEYRPFYIRACRKASTRSPRLSMIFPAPFSPVMAVVPP